MVKRQRKGFMIRLLSLVVVMMVLSAAAILRDGRIFGHDLRQTHAAVVSVAQGSDTLSVQPDGTFVVNTRVLAKDVQGYGGPVPLKIHIDKDGRLTAIEAEPNAESPSFFDRAKELFSRWQGKTIDEAMAEDVDAVSGATFSSKAIIRNVQRGLAYAKQHGLADGGKGAQKESAERTVATGWTLGSIVALIAVLLGAVVPLFTNNRRLHLVQLVVNVVVLGLWTGTFVSYTLFLRLFAGGVSLSAIGTLAAPLLMLIVALLYPLAGRSGHYCAHVCPFGSARSLPENSADASCASRRMCSVCSPLCAICSGAY